jgi:tetratricopeptide (TPR) repeat protein
MRKKIGNIMNIWNHFTRNCCAAALWIFLGSHAQGQTSSRLSTSFLARGEQALLEISVAGGQPAEIPQIPKIRNLTIQPSGRGPQTRLLPGSRKLEYVFEYLISSYEVGKEVIPPIQVTVSGIKTFTEPLNFVIFNPDELQWSEVQAGGKTIRYASSFRALNEKPFDNETTPTEIKVFVPEELVVEDWGIPDFERDGLAAWRFQPSPMRGRINLLGQRYVSVAYPSTITPTRAGKIGIGPAKIRLMTREMLMDPFPRQVSTEVYLQVPKLEIQALPLPEGAPEGFENAVGNFRLSASTAVTDVQQGDPIPVDLIVSGSGNLDTLHPPKLENTAAWKIYGSTSEQRGDERRQLSGTVVFHQSIRPLELKSAIPPFRLIYFDPKDKTYKTLTTEPIALKMRASALPNSTAGAEIQSLPVPFERMTDILALLHPAQLTLPAVPTLPAWLGHAVGGLIALILIAKALWLRYAPRLRNDPRREAQLKELREIEKSKSNDDTEFLKSAGGFIERWLGGNPAPVIQAVLAERDAVCFRAEKPKTVLNQERRHEILKLLRRAALAGMVIASLASAPSARAADTATQALEAYDAAKYDEAVKLWLGAGNYAQLAADTLYNIGNACYRSGSPGDAALYYRRALARDSGHQEARQNLRFIERKYGAIVVHRPEFQYSIAKFPLSAWQSACWTGLWLCGLALLVFPATQPGARLRVVAVGVLVIAPILVSVGALGWRYFPSDAEFAPLARQAVIIEEKVALHSDAARTAPEVIDAPPGSLCEIITESGRWVYVAFATKTRGWVPIESIEKVVPDKTPEPPKFRKTKADGKSA